MEDGLRCPICFEPPLKTGDWVKCPNQHGYHVICLQKWLMQRPQRPMKCPTCKVTFHTSIQKLLKPVQEEYDPCPRCDICDYLEEIEYAMPDICPRCDTPIGLSGFCGLCRYNDAKRKGRWKSFIYIVPLLFILAVHLDQPHHLPG